MKKIITLLVGLFPTLALSQVGSSSDPFTSLDQAAAVKTAGTYYFNLSGTSFNTHVNNQGYIMIAIDFGDGSGGLPQGSALSTSARGILNPTALSALSSIAEVRISTSTGNLDVTSSNSTIISRVQSNTPLHAGTSDNAINDDWSGTNNSYLTTNSICSNSTSGLNNVIIHVCGNTSGTHWIPSGGDQREIHSSGEIADSEYFQLWVRGTHEDHTGPAGVGASDGNSELELWLKADAGTSTTTDGANISQWNDQSGNGINLSQATSSNQPSYEDDGTNAINGKPVVHFDGDDDISYSSTLNISNDFTVFVVKEDNTTQPGANAAYFSVRGTTSSTGIVVYRDVANDKFISKATGSYTEDFISTSGVTNNAPFVAQYKRSGTTMYMSRFGGSYITDAGTSGPIDFGTSPTTQLGSAGSTVNYLQGNIAEAIVYSRSVNAAEKITIENYLAAKYGLTLSANDVYTQDNNGNGDYDHDVAGVGRVDASNFVEDAQGSGIVRVQEPDDLDDDEFFMWGHDNGSLQASETTDINIGDGIEARLARVWRASEVNSSGTAVDIGSLSISFDLTGLGNVAASDLRLLVDTDNDGFFNDETGISGAIAKVNNVFKFSGVTALANGLRFTLGTINTNQTPLPIELVSFTAEAIGENNVELNWETASSLNNDYFTMERSANANDWQVIRIVDAQGNSVESQHYSEVDRDAPIGTSYYRLKQTDFDGKWSYSPIEAVIIHNPEIKLIVYPNPAKQRLCLSNFDMDAYIILSTSGKEIVSGNAGNSIDIRTMENGTYMLEVRDSDNNIERCYFTKQ